MERLSGTVWPRAIQSASFFGGTVRASTKARAERPSHRAADGHLAAGCGDERHGHPRKNGRLPQNPARLGKHTSHPHNDHHQPPTKKIKRGQVPIRPYAIRCCLKGTIVDSVTKKCTKKSGVPGVVGGVRVHPGIHDLFQDKAHLFRNSRDSAGNMLA